MTNEDKLDADEIVNPSTEGTEPIRSNPTAQIRNRIFQQSLWLPIAWAALLLLFVFWFISSLVGFLSKDEGKGVFDSENLQFSVIMLLAFGFGSIVYLWLYSSTRDDRINTLSEPANRVFDQRFEKRLDNLMYYLLSFVAGMVCCLMAFVVLRFFECGQCTFYEISNGQSSFTIAILTSVSYVLATGFHFFILSQKQLLTRAHYKRAFITLFVLFLLQFAIEFSSYFDFLFDASSNPQNKKEADIAPFEALQAIVIGIIPRFSGYIANLVIGSNKKSGNSGRGQYMIPFGFPLPLHDAYIDNRLREYGLHTDYDVLDLSDYEVLNWILCEDTPSAETAQKSTLIYLDQLILKEWVESEFFTLVNSGTTFASQFYQKSFSQNLFSSDQLVDLGQNPSTNNAQPLNKIQTNNYNNKVHIYLSRLNTFHSRIT